ncbi:hypothetical protein Q0812_10190 [Brevundimonas sp. 2R-24]|uniref:Uncharacterized protein n=1 Tax=Peiella sedimenti TaxID=3061083 RepID=A0ABT8SMS7_9CAUL|nr:hypothetical protein [Caulobacteraceae bacterium XZ-24]
MTGALRFRVLTGLAFAVAAFGASSAHASSQPLVSVLPEADGGGEWVSAIVSGLIGIIGAILGAAVAVWGTERVAHKNRQRERAERVKALAFAIFQKATYIYSDASSLRDTLRQAKEGLAREVAEAEAGPELEPHVRVIHALCMRVMPWGNLPERLSFTTDEVWAAKEIVGDSLLNAVMNLDRQHSALLKSADRYSLERERFQETLEVREVEGLVVQAGFDADNAARSLATINRLDDLLRHIDEAANELARDAFEALRSLAEAESRPLGDATVFAVRGPDGDEVILRAKERPKKSLKAPYRIMGLR